MNKISIYSTFAIFVSLAFILTIEAGSQQFTYSCPNSQTILRLSSETNALAELGLYNNYPIEICYNEIFSVNFNRATPQDCSNNNLIFNLTENTAASEGYTVVEETITTPIYLDELQTITYNFHQIHSNNTDNVPPIPSGTHFRYDPTTAKKLCELKGYTNFISYGNTHFDSPDDNHVRYWDNSTNSFKDQGARSYNAGINWLTCGKIIQRQNGTSTETIRTYDSTPICFGDLVCRKVPSSVSPGTNEKEILSLSREDKGTFGVAGHYNGIGNYKILCSSEYANTIDLTPPGQVRNATVIFNFPRTIIINWVNPTDADFKEVLLYLNGRHVNSTPFTNYVFKGLTPDTNYRIDLQTKDQSGNINNTNITLTARTPPLDFGMNLTVLSPVEGRVYRDNSILINITAINADKIDYSIESLDITNETYTSPTFITLPDGTYSLFVKAYKSNLATAAETVTFSINTSSQNETDTTPPGAVSNLSLKDKSKNHISVKWINPTDLDFNSALIYLNGKNIANTSHTSYKITDLSANTFYTIVVYTKDNSGNVNTSGKTIIIKTEKSDNHNEDNGDDSDRNPSDNLEDEIYLSPYSYNEQNATNSYDLQELNPKTTKVETQASMGLFVILVFVLLVLIILLVAAIILSRKR